MYLLAAKRQRRDRSADRLKKTERTHSSARPDSLELAVAVVRARLAGAEIRTVRADKSLGCLVPFLTIHRGEEQTDRSDPDHSPSRMHDNESRARSSMAEAVYNPTEMIWTVTADYDTICV